MKILFLSFPWTIDILGTGYLSAVLKKESYTVDITRPDTMWKDLANMKPDILAISTTTGRHVKYLELVRQIKKRYPCIFVVFGGPHPTYFPEIAKEDCVDFIIRGEGEFSFLKLVKSIESGYLSCEKERTIEPLIQNLDTIPFPDRELIYKYPKNYNNPIKNVFTSRSCLFSCSFCYMSIFRELYKGQTVLRYRFIDSVINECIELKEKYPTKFIFFADDEFTVSGERLEEFRDKYKKYVELPFHCQLRIDYLTEEKVMLLKESGCFSVTFAVETGDEVTRWDMLNKKLTNRQIIKGCDILKRYNIPFRIENMIGLPRETIDGALKTLDFNIKLKPTVSWVSLYQPYPGTVLGELCKRSGLFKGDSSKFKEDFFEDTVLPLNKKGEFINLQRLFSLAVDFPILKYIIKLLIKLPPNRLYWWVSKIHKKFLYDHKLYKIK